MGSQQNPNIGDRHSHSATCPNQHGRRLKTRYLLAMYCFIDWVETRGEGFRPDLPDGVGFTLLAEPGQEVNENKLTWAIFRTRIPYDDRADYPQCEFVSAELDGLIRSGETYPPALAFARDDMQHLTAADVSRADFARIYTEQLRFHLLEQRKRRFFLAEARESGGFKSAGTFYWIVASNTDQTAVRWISSDFFVYTDAFNAFDIDDAIINVRTRKPTPPITEPTPGPSA